MTNMDISDPGYVSFPLSQREKSFPILRPKKKRKNGFKHFKCF